MKPASLGPDVLADGLTSVKAHGATKVEVVAGMALFTSSCLALGNVSRIHANTRDGQLLSKLMVPWPNEMDPPSTVTLTGWPANQHIIPSFRLV